jgi:hypothetical protein
MRLVPVKYLRTGNEVAVSIIDKESKLLLKRGEVLTQVLIDKLNEQGIGYVYINDEYCLNDNPGHFMDCNVIYHCVAQLKKLAHRLRIGVTGAQDLGEAFEISHSMVEYLMDFGKEIRIVYEPAKITVNFVTEESIYVAIMSVVLGIKMGLTKEELIKLCVGVLLRDIAMISPKIKEQGNYKFSQHPQLGYDYLKEKYFLDEEILNAILQHHELCDGTGYPNRLKGEDIGDFAKIIAPIEKFYELKRNHDELYDTQLFFEKKLYKMLKGFDINVISYFLQFTELFSLDTLLRLTNNDIAVVIKNNIENPFRPLVKILKSETYELGTEINLEENETIGIKNVEYYV